MPRLRAVLRSLVLPVVVSAALGPALAGCGTEPADPASAPDGSSEQRFPDIEAADLAPEDDGTYSLAVTVSSPYDSPERYADGWRVLTEDGTVLGEWTLGHDHASEQPFTRTQTGLEIPDGVERIVVEGHDTEHGYGGETLLVDVG